jgi:uncharacterized Zn finger protein
VTVFYDWRPYVPVAERRRRAEREMQRRRKKGHPVAPVVVEGRAIARTFWGKAWCDNLESYSDFANRLPRGRTYVRNGSVVDLQVAPGLVTAAVAGSDLYEVTVKVAPVPRPKWTAICRDCAGAIDSLVELLQGRFSKGVMERISRQGTGLFPAPAQIELSCSCPDWAEMCKHVAAVLYGIGARLDHEPELLFRLRAVDEKDLLVRTGAGLPLSKAAPAKAKLLASDQLSELFGIDLAAPVHGADVREAGKPARRSRGPAAKAERPAVRRNDGSRKRPKQPRRRATRNARR